jgi:drug/metabolite transporter (DMT)-like permease
VRRVHSVDLMLLTTVLLWALNFTVTKYVITHGWRPLAYSGMRYGVATALFTAVTFARERSLRVERRDLPLLLAPAALFLLLNQFGYVYSLKYASASTVALVLGSTPIFVALFAFVVGLERLSRSFWLAAGFSFAGVALVALGSGGVSGDLKGDLLAVATAVTWAAYSVAITPLMRRYSPWRISSIVLIGTWFGLIVAGAPQLSKQEFHFGWLTWLGFVYAVLGPLVVTNILWFTAIDRVGPSRASLFGNLQPFFAVIFALLLLSEHMSALQIGGGVAIGLGIVLERRLRLTAVQQPPAD